MNILSVKLNPPIPEIIPKNIRLEIKVIKGFPIFNFVKGINAHPIITTEITIDKNDIKYANFNPNEIECVDPSVNKLSILSNIPQSKPLLFVPPLNWSLPVAICPKLNEVLTAFSPIFLLPFLNLTLRFLLI